MSRRVVVVQELLAQYRVPFFEDLRTALAAHSIELVLVHGQPSKEMAARNDGGRISWARHIRNLQLTLGPVRLVWQPAASSMGKADLVVVEQANRLVLNYVLLAVRGLPGAAKVAFWGHGANLQARSPNSKREWFKRIMATAPDWWFAYTEGCAKTVMSTGFPSTQLTVVQNAVKTHEYQSVSVAREPLRCVFIGGLSKTKRIDFLIEAGRHLSRVLPGFELLVVGDGPLRHLIQEEAQQSHWLTYAGPAFGREKAELLASAQLTLMPGLVGLAIVDTFAAGTPIVTTAIDFHSPEIEYLQTGTNGIILPKHCSAEGYAQAVASLLRDPDQLSRLRKGCRQSAQDITIERMVDNFTQGILAALKHV